MKRQTTTFKKKTICYFLLNLHVDITCMTYSMCSQNHNLHMTYQFPRCCSQFSPFVICIINLSHYWHWQCLVGLGAMDSYVCKCWTTDLVLSPYCMLTSLPAHANLNMLFDVTTCCKLIILRIMFTYLIKFLVNNVQLPLDLNPIIEKKNLLQLSNYYSPLDLESKTVKHNWVRDILSVNEVCKQ